MEVNIFEELLYSPWQFQPMAKVVRQRKIIGIYGCGGIPEFIITRHYEGLQTIERLCSKCIQKEKQKDYNKKY
jgi:hypothetical protein